MTGINAKGSAGEAGAPVVRYRYRTNVLIGRWQMSPSDAALDAIRAGQAEPCEAAENGIRWRVNGEIESDRETPMRPPACRDSAAVQCGCACSLALSTRQGGFTRFSRAG